MPAGAGPVWGLRPEPPIYVRPSPAPMCPLRWPVPPAPATSCSPAHREHRALVAGTAGFSGVGLCEPSCLPQEEDQLGGLTYFLAFPVEVEAGTGDWVEAATT